MRCPPPSSAYIPKLEASSLGKKMYVEFESKVHGNCAHPAPMNRMGFALVAGKAAYKAAESWESSCCCCPGQLQSKGAPRSPHAAHAPEFIGKIVYAFSEETLMNSYMKSNVRFIIPAVC